MAAACHLPMEMRRLFGSTRSPDVHSFLIGLALSTPGLLDSERPTPVSDPNNLAPEVDIAGIYRCEGAGPTGSKYNGVVKIEKKGQAYSLTWVLGSGETSVGVGIRKGHTLSANCLSKTKEGLSAAVVVYDIGEGPQLIGRFTELGGPGVLRNETLTLLRHP
jgi:hypothetical protein